MIHGLYGVLSYPLLLPFLVSLSQYFQDYELFYVCLSVSYEWSIISLVLNDSSLRSKYLLGDGVYLHTLCALYLSSKGDAFTWLTCTVFHDISNVDGYLEYGWIVMEALSCVV